MATAPPENRDPAHCAITERARQRAGFPSTAWSAVRAAAGPDPALAAAALERLCQTYRASIVRWFETTEPHPADAEDATQEFLQHVFGKPGLNGFAPGPARFRQWLAACLRQFTVDRWRRAHAVKRRVHLRTEELGASDATAPACPPDVAVDRRIAEQMHQAAVRALELDWLARGRAAPFAQLAPFLLEPPAEGEYGRAATALGVPPRRVKRLVFDLREEYFDRLRAVVAQTVEPAELGEELKYIGALLRSYHLASALSHNPSA